jgi:anti-sigma factor RsiW
MCDERERLIGYVYDECDAAERRAIESHLEECGTCRSEIGGFRRVRQDLLAWDVPDHESVWRPFAPPRTTPGWQEVPAWAMAAAALAIFAVGAGGGALTHALVPHDPVIRVADTSAAQAVPQVTTADLQAFEARMMGFVRTEIADRTPPAPGLARVSMTPQERAEFEADIMRRVIALQVETSNRHDATWGVLATEFGQQTTRLNKLSEQVETLGQFVNVQGR